MKKIWQKSLASMVSAALCLTAFVGCLTVNAATDYTGTINSNGVAVATTATEAKLDVAVSVSNVTPGIAYTGLKATTDFGTLKGVEIKSGDVKVEELSTDGETSIPAIDENGSFIIAAKDTSVGANDYVLTLTFAKNASVELVDGATYPVTITYLGSQEVGAANWNEDSIGFNVAVKDITVAAVATKPVYNADLKFSSTGAVFKADYSMVYYISKTRYDSWTDFSIKVEKDNYNGNEKIDPNVVTLTSDDMMLKEDGTPDLYNDKYYKFELTGISAKEVSGAINATIYATVNNVPCYGVTKTYNLVDYAMTFAGDGSYLGNAMIAFLNYATDAQFAFTYNTNNPANARLTEEQKVTSTPSLENKLAVTSRVPTQTAKVSAATLSLESQILVNIYVNPMELSPDDLYVKFEWTDSSSNAISDIVPCKGTESVDYNDVTCSKVAYAGIPAKEMRSVFQFTIVDSEGNALSHTRSYSIESYSCEMQNNGLFGSVVKSMIVFGDQIALYFINR